MKTLPRTSLLSLSLAICVGIVFWTGCSSQGEIPGGKTVNMAELSGGIESDQLVLVKFGATWCPPCREIEKEIDSLDAEKLGVKIVKIDIDEQPELSSKCKVSSIPHLMLVRNGKTIQERRGFQSADSLTSWISRHQ